MTRFSKEIARYAINHAKPFIQKLIDEGITKRKDLHIVVGNSDGKILADESFGNPDLWEHPYNKIAQSKFEITVRTGQPTRIIQQITPELVGEPGDTFYWGSWIDGGIVVACSGVQPYWDEAFSKIIVAIIRAIVTEVQEKEIAEGGDFRK